jgi:hypothetical protein
VDLARSTGRNKRQCALLVGRLDQRVDDSWRISVIQADRVGGPCPDPKDGETEEVSRQEVPERQAGRFDDEGRGKLRLIHHENNPCEPRRSQQFLPEFFRWHQHAMSPKSAYVSETVPIYLAQAPPMMSLAPSATLHPLRFSAMSKVHRSAITGRFVTGSTAQRHPKTTITQSTPSNGSGGRSAITGRFVTDATVRRHPDTTVDEGK